MHKAGFLIKSMHAAILPPFTVVTGKIIHTTLNSQNPPPPSKKFIFSWSYKPCTVSNLLSSVKAGLNKSFILLARYSLQTWGSMGLIYVLTGCRDLVRSLCNWKTDKCWKLNKKSMSAQEGVGVGKWLERTSAWLEFNSVLTLCWLRLGGAPLI